jgi:hypothetical protein
MLRIGANGTIKVITTPCITVAGFANIFNYVLMANE